MGGERRRERRAEEREWEEEGEESRRETGGEGDGKTRQIGEGWRGRDEREGRNGSEGVRENGTEVGAVR